MRILPVAGLAGALCMAAFVCLADSAPTNGAADTTAATGATQPATAATDAPKPKPAKDPNQVICKTTSVTGSRLGGERVCMTRQAWADQTRSSRDTLEDTQRSQTNPQQ